MSEAATPTILPMEQKSFVQNPGADWRSMLRDAQAAQMHLSPEAKIEADKASATVRIFEKMNLSDRRPWGVGPIADENLRPRHRHADCEH